MQWDKEYNIKNDEIPNTRRIYTVRIMDKEYLPSDPTNIMKYDHLISKPIWKDSEWYRFD